MGVKESKKKKKKNKKKNHSPSSITNRCALPFSSSYRRNEFLSWFLPHDYWHCPRCLIEVDHVSEGKKNTHLQGEKKEVEKNEEEKKGAKKKNRGKKRDESRFQFTCTPAQLVIVTSSRVFNFAELSESKNFVAFYYKKKKIKKREAVGEGEGDRKKRRNRGRKKKKRGDFSFFEKLL